ncbi:MAG: alpha/beta hydrolase [Myxococcales bacterium]|nr:alpha/beta hydrolase [Myxococcales bacterium]
MLERSSIVVALVLWSGAAWAQGVASAPAASMGRGGGSWHVPCPFDSSKALLPVTCGRLKVPENPGNTGRVVEIAFMVVKAPRSIDQHGPVVFLNGGPGDNSLYYAEQLVTHAHIRDVVVDRDWIFFDQRGTGRSTPALYCEPQGEWLKQVTTCRDTFIAQGVDLAQYNSVRIAGDMEALRSALGVRQWNLWGNSYGARLAVISARTYPASVRSIILDASGVPEGQELVDDARGTEAALDRIFAKCATDSTCASAYPQLRSRFIATLPRLRQQPLVAGDQRYDDGALLGFIRAWLYPRGYSTFEQRIQSLLVFMDAAARSDGQLMVDTRQRMRSDEGLDTRKDPPVPMHGRHSIGQNLSVYCHESKPFASREEAQRAAAGSEMLRALLEGFGDDAACSLWPAGRASGAARTGVYDGPQLVFTGELDASSSGLAGYRIAMLNANAIHVVFRNGMHGQFPMELPTAEDTPYRMCALRLARAFVADSRGRLDTSCADTRPLRLVR